MQCSNAVFYYRAKTAAINTFLSLTAYVHLVFVVKYWLLSRKLKGENSELKAQIWYYSLTLMILGTCVAQTWITWDDFTLDATKWITVVIVTASLFLPEVITVYLLFDAILSIRKSTEGTQYVISPTQVWLQVIAICAFVVANCVLYSMSFDIKI